MEDDLATNTYDCDGSINNGDPMILLKQCQSGFPNICSDKDFKERYEMEKLSSIHQHGG